MTTTTDDTLLGGRVRLRQPRDGLRAGIDAVLLAAAVPARPGDTLLEAGCGSGAAFLCALARVPLGRVIALERDAGLAELARANAAANGWAELVEVICGDVADPALRRHLPACHHAMANPPWWPAGTPPPAARRADATHAAGAALADWAGLLAGALRPRGTVTLLLPAARWSAGAAALAAAGCGGIALLPLRPRAGLAAGRAVLQARRAGRGADRLLPSLVLHEGARWSAAADRILRDGQALPGFG